MRAQLRAVVIILFLASVVCVFFGEALFGQAYYPGDIARIYLPQRAELRQALRAGDLPWWSTTFGAGYPLLAEGEVGALYPPNWPLYALLPVELALNASIILHYVISGLGLYLLARALALSVPAALCAALAWALGGFGIAHLSHISILSTIAWLPWMLWLTYACLRNARCKFAKALGLAAVTALQFLAGHPQMSLLNLIATAALGAALLLRRGAPRRSRVLGLWAVALLAGALLAAPQLLPAYQLGTLSQRAGGLEGEFFTSYSFHPFLVSTFVAPFALGNPYPQGSVELMGYMGLLPLALGSVALWRSRRPSRWFLVALAAVGLAMAFGRWNPLYHYLQHVPILNLFRVPARYLCWTSLGIALLAGYGWDALGHAPTTNKPQPRWLDWVHYGLQLVCVIVAVIVTGRDTDALVAAWRGLPLLLAATSLTVVALARTMRPATWTATAFAVLLLDLYAYGAVLDRTYNATLPLAEVQREPLSVAVLRDDDSLYRVYTKEEIVPALAPLRESLYPNLASSYGVASANLYMPLVPTAYGEYLAALDARRLNLLNARYYLIPQLLPVDEASELYDVANPYADVPYGRWIDVPTLSVTSLSIESCLSHAADSPDGALAASILLGTTDGREISLPLRAGIETAEWAYERSDVLKVVAHSPAPVASTWPARSGYPPEDHVGHTYLSTHDLGGALEIDRVRISAAVPEAFVRIQRISLVAADGTVHQLAHLVGLADHSIVYRSEDVLVYRNNDALPRAWLLPAQRVMASAEGLSLPERLRAADVQPAAVSTYASRRVVVRCSATEAAYLVLADLDYPGWRATLDGADVPITVAEGLFRAVALPAGTHEVVFTYHPLAGLLAWR